MKTMTSKKEQEGDLMVSEALNRDEVRNGPRGFHDTVVASYCDYVL